MSPWKRLKNLWKLSVLNFDAATKDHMIMFDGVGNRIELKKESSTIKKKPAKILQERSLEESIKDEGGYPWE